MRRLATYLLYGTAPGENLAVRRVTKRGGELVDTHRLWQHLVRARDVRRAYYFASLGGLTLSYHNHAAGLIALKRVGLPSWLNMRERDSEQPFRADTPYLQKLQELIDLRTCVERDADISDTFPPGPLTADFSPLEAP